MNSTICIKEYRFTIIKAESEETDLFLRLKTDQSQHLYLKELSQSAEILPVNVFNDPRTYLCLQYHLFNKIKSISEITLLNWIELIEWKRKNNIGKY